MHLQSPVKEGSKAVDAPIQDSKERRSIGYDFNLLLIRLHVCQCDCGFMDLEEVGRVEIGEVEDDVSLEVFEAFLEGRFLEPSGYALESSFYLFF